MFLRITNFYKWRRVKISERSKGTHTSRQAVGAGNFQVLKVLVSVLIVLQIPSHLLLAQSYSLCKKVIDDFMFIETIFLFMLSGVIYLVLNRKVAEKNVRLKSCSFSYFLPYL